MKKKYTIPYKYTIIGHATVYADSVEEAVELVEANVPCDEPEDRLVAGETGIEKYRFEYLDFSFEILDNISE